MAEPRVLGSSGISVHPIGLGGMPMSIQGRPSREQSLETLRTALEAGCDFVDTADVYCLDDADIGHNE
nr:aldo/keto reductase [Deltaproteobacteria bacterium]